MTTSKKDKGLGAKNPKAKPKVQDFVRVCKCGERILCQIKNHGHISILTVERNGYLFKVGYVRTYKNSYTFKWDRYFNMFGYGCSTQEIFNLQTGYNASDFEHSINNAKFGQYITKGIIKKLSKDYTAKLNEVTSTMKNYPIFVVKSITPHKIIYIRCQHCDSKMMFRTFKELKHNG